MIQVADLFDFYQEKNRRSQNMVKSLFTVSYDRLPQWKILQLRNNREIEYLT
jgi:hypothetical protein